MSGNESKTEEWMSGFADMIYSLMKPLLRPLTDKWDSVTGDAQAVYDTAGKWSGMAENMRGIALFQRDAATATTDGWTGLSGDAYRAAVDELATSMEDIGKQMDGVKGFLDDAATQVQEAEQLCQDLVYELVEWAALTLAVSAATAIVTLGASAAAGAAAAAAKAGVTGVKIANALRKLATALRKIAAAIKAYKAWLKGQKFLVKQIVKRGVERPLLKAATGLDGDFKTPVLSLLDVKYDLPNVPGVPASP